MMTTANAPRRMTRQGDVVALSGAKTIRVAVSRVAVHPLYRKRRTVKTHYLVHDERSRAQVGDQVTIQESRPLSARKRWRLVSVDRAGAHT